MRPRLIAAFVLLGLIWGSEWLIGRTLETPPLGLLALRDGMAALVLGALVFMRGVSRPSLRVVTIAAVSGISFAALPAILTIWAAERVSPGLLVVILAMTPLLAALMEGRASGGLLAALVGGIAGTTLLASQGLSFALTQWAGAAALLTDAAMIAASVLWVKRELTDIPVVLLAAIQLASAAVVVALWSFLAEGRSGFDWDRKLVWTEVGLALVGSALALPLYYRLLRSMESFQLTASQWMVTIVGVAEALLLVRQTPGLRLLAGAVVLAASLFALLRTEPGRESPVTIGLTGVSLDEEERSVG